jgi:hypothetical protein
MSFYSSEGYGSEPLFTANAMHERAMRDPVNPKLVNKDTSPDEEVQPVNPWESGGPHVGEIFGGKVATSHIVEFPDAPED